MSDDYRMSLLVERHDDELRERERAAFAALLEAEGDEDYEDIEVDEPQENYYTEMHRWMSEHLNRRY